MSVLYILDARKPWKHMLHERYTSGNSNDLSYINHDCINKHYIQLCINEVYDVKQYEKY